MLNVTLRQFQTLQLVAEEGSFSKAAQRLGISQPAISKHIFTLEAKLGFPLFTRRRGNAVELTRRGSAMLAQVSNLLTSADTLEGFAKQARRRQKRVRILAGRFLAQYVIIPNLARLQVERPDLIIELQSLDSPRRAFEPGQRESADLIYVSVLDKKLASSAELIGLAPLAFVARPSHPIVGQLRGRVPVSLPMIMGLPGDASDVLIREALRMARVTNYHVTHTAQLPEVMTALALAGEGVCCAMRPMIKDELVRGALVELDLPRVQLNRVALHNGLTLNDDLRHVDRYFRAVILASS